MAAPMKTKMKFCCQNQALLTTALSSRLNQHLRTITKVAEKSDKADEDSEGFRRYQLRKKTDFDKPRRKFAQAQVVEKPPRSTRMPINQDWTNVWPAAQTFKWSVVPLPVRQGALKVRSEARGDGFPPDKYANTELIKIPNFLHLTPAHVQKQCEAIKKFCTPWPKEVGSRRKMNYHLPVEVITEDFCFSSPSVRDPRARVVTMKFLRSDLKLDAHANEKFQRLIKSRKNAVKFTTDRCPLKKQNYDFLQYLLTALYFESWKVEAWESEMTVADMFQYSWDHSSSKENLVNLLNIYREKEQSVDEPDKRQLSYLPEEEISPDTVTSIEGVQMYKRAVEKLHHRGENSETLNRYKQTVINLLPVQKEKTQSK